KRKTVVVAATAGFAKMSCDRMNINRSWDHIQAKYVGTGHSDMTKYEFASNHHRDSIASHLGHADMLQLLALGDGEELEHVGVAEVARDGVSVVVRGELVLRHVRVARAHVLRLDVVPRPVDVHAVAAHLAQGPSWVVVSAAVRCSTSRSFGLLG
ncbi:MAG: splicing factor 3B subunit 5 family protein, partial [Myxococcota bacterium]